MGTSWGGTDCRSPKPSVSPVAPASLSRAGQEVSMAAPGARAEKAVRAGAMAVRAPLSCAQGLCCPVCGGSTRFKTKESQKLDLHQQEDFLWKDLLVVSNVPCTRSPKDRTPWLLWLPPGHHDRPPGDGLRDTQLRNPRPSRKGVECPLSSVPQGEDHLPL
nr:uncharacterized protein LOC103349155 isoform X8 [Oryctolagus cuniculus]